ncbi:MAG: hypothetical protein ACT4QG_22775 [Sporichthyaceae bacterium]
MSGRVVNVPGHLALATTPALIAVGVSGPGVGYHRGMVLVGIAGVVFGVAVFWSHGGGQITAAGVYGLASAAFVGGAALSWAHRAGAALPGYLFYAALAAYSTNVAMYFLCWRRQGDPVDYPMVDRTDERAWRAAIVLGVVWLSVGVGLWATLPAAREVYNALGFCGVLAIALGVAARPGARVDELGLVLLAAALIVYATTLFGGYGRLQLVALACACALVLCRRFDGRRVKAATLVGAAPLLAVLAHTRHEMVREAHGEAAASRGAPDSWETPLEVFGRLLEGATPFGHGHGSSFFSTAVLPVPRALWEDKPVQFGAELVEIFNPSARAYEQSYAALAQGEWFYNFGLAGLVAMVAVVGLAIRWLDRRLAAGLQRPLVSSTALLQLMTLGLAATFVAGTADLVWNGSSTFVARGMFRGLLFGVVVVVLAVGVRAGRVNAGRVNGVVAQPAASAPSSRGRATTC